ncbi:MAG: hypothetical protein ACTSVA_00945 [Candidatus Njordarchaeales archaeon]
MGKVDAGQGREKRNTEPTDVTSEEKKEKIKLRTSISKFDFLNMIYLFLEYYNKNYGSNDTIDAEKCLYRELSVLEAKQRGII